MESGTKLGHSEVLSLMGKGGMGEMWRARDTKLGREIAIKTPPEEFAKDADRPARFEREAKGTRWARPFLDRPRPLREIA